MNSPVTDMRVLGQLLRCPEGMYAKEIGDFMFASNRTMIINTIDCLKLQAHQNILEIGFGNGKHLPYLFSKEKTIHYMGVETSKAMIAEATHYNKELVTNGWVTFTNALPDKLLNFKELFDVCFSVNTLYFIADPIRYYKHIYQLLNPQGKVIIGFIDKSTGEKAPFAREGFQFYTVEEVMVILKKVGFKNIEKIPFEETLVSEKGKHICRKYWIIIGNS